MKLLTKAIEAKLLKAKPYSTEKQDVSPIIVKFFNPTGSWTWYVLEGERIDADGEPSATGTDWRFFGLVEGFEKELGYFLLSELQSFKGPFGLGIIERDLYFSGKSIKKSTNEVV